MLLRINLQLLVMVTDVEIRALVDRKKIIITKASIRRDLQLQDAKGTACLPNAAIFGELARIWIFYLEQIKTNQAVEIEKPKKRVKKLEGKKKKRTHGLKRLYKVRLTARIESSKEEEDQERMNNKDLFGVNDLDGDDVIVDVTAGKNVKQDATVNDVEVSVAADEVVTTAKSVEGITAATTPQIFKYDVTQAQTLIEIKAAKPRARGVIVQEPSKFITTSSSQPSQLPHAKDKGKESWQLAEQLQAQKREQLSIEERSKLLAKLIEFRRKYFAAKRAEEIRNKPPTKGKRFDTIKKMFDKVYERVNTFVAMNLELMKGSKKPQAEVTEGSFKRAKDEIEQESVKRQRLKKEDDTAELKRCLEIVLEDDDDETIKATPLSSKSHTILEPGTFTSILMFPAFKTVSNKAGGMNMALSFIQV
uniref:Uncharacterized protein n=1 Tax=Tanacetum cinerariifolium TaxID=118510 RepID=A0A6L2MD41_TANCI|nr:hypothetical protein [Tanacetum cinerariifolium]